ncbi:MAG: fibronectin type III domain-containing protein [Candidatus Latescibacteria bacterium]|nr:fibronectin type III domain-containing protein [Candidatus Latescibacterota bacterium]
MDPDLFEPVQLTVVADDTTATVTLSWTAYAGTAPFSAYRALRSELDLVVVATLVEITDVAQTTFVDAGPRGDTEYIYRVVVVTDRGEQVPSHEVSGALHRHLASWPVTAESAIRGFRLSIATGTRSIGAQQTGVERGMSDSTRLTNPGREQ